MYSSAVNQPNRVVIRSDDDDTTPSTAGFNTFSVNLPTPALNAKTVDIIRATIPIAQVNIPDYQLVFWYYRLPTFNAIPNATHLRCVRLLPSWVVASPTNFPYVVNRLFTDPDDMTKELAKACLATGDSVIYNPFFTAADITFSYNTITKRVSMIGQNSTFHYAPAGYNDPLVSAAMRSGTIKVPLADFATTQVVQGPNQPIAVGYTLNLRLGFALSGQSRGLSATSSTFPYANAISQPLQGSASCLADSFPNLVYTTCVYLYTNVANGSSSVSNNRQNLLAIIPVNAAPLGVANYVAAMTTPLKNVAAAIQNITIEMRDDEDQPFTLPDSSPVNVELYFTY